MELVHEVVGADSADLGFPGTGDDKIAGDEFVAGAFFDVVLFTGDERFVDLEDAFLEVGVEEDLAKARLALLKVTQHTIQHALSLLGVSAPDHM